MKDGYEWDDLLGRDVMMRFCGSMGTYRVDKINARGELGHDATTSVQLSYLAGHVPHGCDPSMWHVVEDSDHVSSGGERVAVVPQPQEPAVHFAGMDELQTSTEELDGLIWSTGWSNLEAIGSLNAVSRQQTTMISKLVHMVESMATERDLERSREALK